MVTVERLAEDKSLAISYVKAFGIILVVIGHYKNAFFNIYHPYLFHMPLFFFVGGYLFNPKKTLAVVFKDVLAKYISYIVLTYLVLGGVSYFVSSIYTVSLGKPFSASILQTIMGALKNNFHNNPLFLVAWFLFAYAWVVAIGGGGLKYLCGLGRLPCAILSVCIGLGVCYFGIECIGQYYRSVGVSSGNQWMNLSCQIMVGCGFYLLGWAARVLNVKFNSIYVFVLLTSVFLWIREQGLVTSLVMAWSYYPSGFYVSMFCALTGIYACFFLAFLLSRGLGELRLMRVIGDESKSIMSYHILSMVVLDYFFYLLGRFNFVGAGSSHHYLFPGSMPVYVAFGVFVPLSLKLAFDLAKRRFMAEIYCCGGYKNNLKKLFGLIK